MHELINLILASATASIYHAFNFFLQTKAGSSGPVIPFMGKSVPSTAPVQLGLCASWWKSVLMEHISHTLCVIYGCIDSIANWIEKKYIKLNPLCIYTPSVVTINDQVNVISK